VKNGAIGIERKKRTFSKGSKGSPAPDADGSLTAEELSTAAAKVEQAVITLLRKEPFYAHLLTSLRRIYGNDVPTAAVSATGKVVTLWVNPRFFCKEVNEQERIGVLKHEMLHLLFKHPWRETSNMPDAELRNIAADLVVNQFVAPFKLPEGCILLSSFPDAGLEPDQTMEWYYNKLRQYGSTDAGAKVILKEADVCNAQGCDAKWGEKGADHDDGDPSLNGGLTSGDYAEAVVRGMVSKAKAKLSGKEWGDLPAGVQRMVDEICAPPKLPWKRLLRLFAGRGSRTVVRTTRHKESNRFPGEPGIRIKRLQKLVVAVDTSGSIGEKELGEFLAEINGMARAGAEIKLIECDCKIHTVTPFRRNELPKFKGGGGTDFDPVMQWLRDNRHERFGGCIYLTDGCAPTPTIDPRCPVLWVITPEMDVKQGWNFGGIA
jgi:predicted metal-dependent peptidase